MQIFKQWPIYALGRLLPAAIGFGGVAVYTRLLDPQSFGTYALLLSTAYLVAMVAYSWLRVVSLRMMATATAAEEPHLVATIGAAFAAMSLAVSFVIIVVVRLTVPGAGWIAALLTAACAVMSGWFELNVAIVQARLRVAMYGLLQVARSAGALAASLALIAAGFKASALLGGFALGNCAGFGALGLWRAGARGRFDSGLLREFVRFGWPTSASAVSYLSNTVQRFLLNAASGAAAVGIFAAASDFSAQTVGLLIGTATLAGQPLAFRARDFGNTEGLSEQMRQNARLVFGVGLPAAAGLAVLSGPISHVYLGPRFHLDAGPIVAIAAAVMFLSGIRGAYFEQAFEIVRRTRAMAANTIVRLVLTIALSFWTIARFGAIGAAATVLFAEAVGLVLSILWARRLMEVPIPSRSWLKIVAATGAMAGAMALVPDRSTTAGLLLAIIIGAVAYCAAVALAHARAIRAFVVSSPALRWGRS